MARAIIVEKIYKKIIASGGNIHKFRNVVHEKTVKSTVKRGPNKKPHFKERSRETELLTDVETFVFTKGNQRLVFWIERRFKVLG